MELVQRRLCQETRQHLRLASELASGYSPMVGPDYVLGASPRSETTLGGR